MDGLNSLNVKIAQLIAEMQDIENGKNYVDPKTSASIDDDLVKAIRKNGLELPKELDNQSNKQQISGCDCCYIVGQTLVELATGKEISIKAYDSEKPEESVMAIAKARASFYDPKLFGNLYAETSIRSQVSLRLAKALIKNVKEADLLKFFLKNNAEKISGLNCPKILGKLKEAITACETTTNANMDMTALMYSKLKEKLKEISPEDIKGYCDHLLEIAIPEKGDVYFVLKSQHRATLTQQHEEETFLKKYTYIQHGQENPKWKNLKSESDEPEKVPDKKNITVDSGTAEWPDIEEDTATKSDDEDCTSRYFIH